MRVSTRTAIRCLGLVALTTLVVVGAAGALAASAHAVLRSTSPASGGSLDSAPTEVTLTFDESPIGLGSVVRVTGPGGVVVSQGPVRVIDQTVHQPLATDLGGGDYTVDWRVTSSDGHPVSDTFTFTVSGPPRPASTSSMPSPVTGQPDARSGVTSPGPGSWLVGILALTVVGALGAAALRHRSSSRTR